MFKRSYVWWGGSPKALCGFSKHVSKPAVSLLSLQTWNLSEGESLKEKKLKDIFLRREICYLRTHGQGSTCVYGHKPFVNQPHVNVPRASLFFSKPAVVVLATTLYSQALEQRGQTPGREPLRRTKLTSLQTPQWVSISVLTSTHMYGLNIPSRRGQCAVCSHNKPSVFWVSSNAYLFLIEH